MKFSIMSLGLMAASALAAPMRASLANSSTASLEDVATTGFATMNGGTSGGKGGKTIEVASLTELEAAVQGDEAAIVLITGRIEGSGEIIRVGSNKSIIGKDSSAVLNGFTVAVREVKNVILRNFAMEKVVGGDAISVNRAQNVWVDHVDLSSDMEHDKDYYDGLLDITRASDFVTVSNSYMHDHWKASLVGHSDGNEAEDRGHLTVTYHNNYWFNINSRGPSFRYGTGHIYNNFYENIRDCINTRQGAQLLVQNNIWVNTKNPLYSTDGGFAVAEGNDFGGGENVAPKGTLTTVPYKVPELLPASAVKAAVAAKAGVTLNF